MKKKLVEFVLYLKYKLPDKYQFVFVGFFSYVYTLLFIVANIIDYYLNFKKYTAFFASIDMKDKNIFVFLYTTDYFDIHQRPQHLAHAFSKENNNIVFFMTKNQTKDEVKGIQKISENLYLVSNHKLIHYLEKYNLIITGPSNYIFLKLLKNYRKLVYDFPDELDFFPGLSRKKIEKYHRNILQKADLVTPSAEYLDQLILKDNSSVMRQVILNGVFPEDFIGEKIDIYSFETLYPNIQKGNKVVGFYGGLGEGWIDFELLKYCALNRKEYTFIIIGGGNISHFIEKYQFNNIPNVYFLGPKKYKELKYYASFFDVALIPFKLNQFTLGVSPVKSFEYMVQGIPFVSTGLPECKKYTTVLIGETYDDFVKKIDIGIHNKNDSNYREKLKQEGNNNTWYNRTNLITHIIYNGK